MNLPAYLRRALEACAADPARQRVVLALLLQAPRALGARPGHHWRPPPLTQGSPAGGVRAAREN